MPPNPLSSGHLSTINLATAYAFTVPVPGVRDCILAYRGFLIGDLERRRIRVRRNVGGRSHREHEDLFEFVGPNDKEPTKRMYITLGVRGPDVYFFKIIGDAALVAAQKDAFNQFLKSVEFGK